MERKRDELEILSEVLKIAKDGAKKSHIVYKANLNFKIVKDYLDTLMRSNMITLEGRNYKTTERGLRYINNHKDLIELFAQEVL